MRIIGGHDYYDNAMAHGIDTSIAFIRKNLEDADVISYEDIKLNTTKLSGISFQKTRERQKYVWKTLSTYKNNNAEYNADPITVYFAGKRYNGIQIHEKSFDASFMRYKTIYIWSREKLMEFLDQIGAKLSKNTYQDYERTYLSSRNIEQYFGQKETEAEIQWLIENKISIAIDKSHLWEGRKLFDKTQAGWKINSDGLNRFEFYKAIDPYQAFQEIQQYVSGVLPQSGEKMITLTDEKVILAKHGMDNRSFKKEPTKKRI